MRQTLLILLGVIALAACSGKSTVAKPEPLRQIDQPQVRGESRWSISTASSRGLGGLRPLLAAGRVFVGDSKGRIQALDAEGELLWSQKTDYRLSAGPALADGALIFGTLSGEAIALEASDGTLRWSADLSSEVIAPPAGDRDLVVLRSGDGRIYGLDPATGERRWTLNRSVPALILRGSGNTVLDGNAAYVGMDNGRVIALDRNTGEPIWEEAISLPTGRSEIERIVDVDADLLLINDVLFAASFGGDMVALATTNGRALWRRSMASYTGMDFDGRCLYITDADAVLWCLDPSNGAAIWQQEQLKHRGLSAPLAFKGNVLVSDFEGYMHAVSAADGKIIGRRKVVKDAVNRPMQAADGIVYVLGRGGRLRALDWVPLNSAG